jgi:hypothetical protein
LKKKPPGLDCKNTVLPLEIIQRMGNIRCKKSRKERKEKNTLETIQRMGSIRCKKSRKERKEQSEYELFGKSFDLHIVVEEIRKRM